jgi:hypothetical protein
MLELAIGGSNCSKKSLKGECIIGLNQKHRKINSGGN